ncbi:MAG: hypothetical protein AB7H85_01960 [Dehalococcoidia bacterium]
MFLGTIPAEARPILHEIVQGWETKELAVGCSGNFTIERTMADLGLTLRSCDVSLYSYAIGSALSGQPVDIRLSERGRELAPWAEGFLGDADSAAVSIMLLLDYANVFKRPARHYSQAVLTALAHEWPDLHARSLERFRAKRPVQVASYFNGDVRQYIEDLPADVPFMSFPPFYKGGYEALFRSIGALVEWPAPTYEIITDNAVEDLMGRVMAKFPRWCIGLKEEPPELRPLLRGVVERKGAIPMYVYAETGPRRYVAPAISKVAPLGMPEMEPGDAVTAESRIELRRLPVPQFEFLRTRHLAKHIQTVAPTAAALVVVDGKAAGAFGFVAEHYRYNGLYLLSDFAVTREGKLSKLVLYAALSREAQLLAQRVLNRRLRTVLTTAFSEHPVSMKYRGLFRLKKREGPRDDGRYMLNYESPSGRWTLQEGFEEWLSKHHRQA